MIFHVMEISVCSLSRKTPRGEKSFAFCFLNGCGAPVLRLFAPGAFR